MSSLKLLVVIVGLAVGAIVTISVKTDCAAPVREPSDAGDIADSTTSESESPPSLIRQPLNRELVNDAAPREFVRASSLPKSACHLFACANQVLEDVGDDPIPPDSVIAEDDIRILETICASDNEAINAADKVVRELQNSYVPEMVKTIQECVAAGKTPPYPNINGVGLPRDKHPYDRFVTTSYQGATYLLILPYTKDLMDKVDSLRTAQDLRVANVRSIIKPLFTRRT